MSTSAAPGPDFGEAPVKKRGIVWKWSLGITAIILVFLLWQCGSGLYSARQLSESAVQHFHEELNSGNYEQICSEADEGFVRSGSRDELLKFLQGVHTKLGEADRGTLQSVNVNATINGTFITTVYNTQFASGQAAETFTWIKKNGVLKLYGYHL